MTILGFLGHVWGLFLPALGVATVLIAVPRLWPRTSRGRWSLKTEALALMGGGALVMLTGLAVFGRDGKMLTYTALVLVMGTLAWWNRRR
ncbi:MAG: hypothetical protein R3E56_00765 [Burkholderiaceae bacterium]